MRCTLQPETLRRLDIQGFESVDERRLAEVAPWLRLAFGTCAALAAVGTATASPIRRLTGTGPLPRRGAPSRFACGLGGWSRSHSWSTHSASCSRVQALAAASHDRDHWTLFLPDRRTLTLGPGYELLLEDP